MNTFWATMVDIGVQSGPEGVANRMRSGLHQGIRFVLILVGVVVLIGIIIALIRIVNQQRRIAEDQVREKKWKTLPDGQPAPPIGRGFCQMCQRSYDEVYFFPSGTRLCPPCYKIESEKSNPSTIL
jgi:hypothetical protein